LSFPQSNTRLGGHLEERKRERGKPHRQRRWTEGLLPGASSTPPSSPHKQHERPQTQNSLQFLFFLKFSLKFFWFFWFFTEQLCGQRDERSSAKSHLRRNALSTRMWSFAPRESLSRFCCGLWKVHKREKILKEGEAKEAKEGKEGFLFTLLHLLQTQASAVSQCAQWPTIAPQVFIRSFLKSTCITLSGIFFSFPNKNFEDFNLPQHENSQAGSPMKTNKTKGTSSPHHNSSLGLLESTPQNTNTLKSSFPPLHVTHQLLRLWSSTILVISSTALSPPFVPIESTFLPLFSPAS